MLLNLLTIFAGETYRLFVEISPYLILGFFFAGLIHTVLGEDVIKKHFARSGFVATLKAAIFGIHYRFVLVVSFPWLKPYAGMVRRKVQP